MLLSYCMYLRKSRADLEAEQRGEGETLARHETALLALAKSQDLAVTEIYREIVSGDTIAARPLMQRLLGEVEQGLWSGVLVMEVERLARGDTVDQGIMAQAFKYSSTKIHTPAKTFDPSDEFDEEYFEFGLFMSRREYKAINRRLQRGRLASVLEGKYVGSGAPYGYERIKLSGAKGYTLAPHPRHADIVRLVFEWYVHGIDGVHVGTSAIARRLDSFGVPPPQGEHWSPATLRDILQNPVYTGKIRWNFRPVMKSMAAGKRLQSRPRSADCRLVDGLHPAVVEPALWQRAQALARANSAAKVLPAKTMQNPLAGLLLCGECGRRMVRKPGRAGSPATLLCTTPGCTTVSCYLPAVESQLLHALEAFLGNYTVCPAGKSTSTENSTSLLTGITADLEEVRRQQGKLCDLLERGIYDEQTFADRSALLRGRSEVLTAGAAMLEAQLTREAHPSIKAEVSLLDIYSKAPSPALQNALLKAVLEKVVYEKAHGSRWQTGEIILHLYPKLRPW